MPNLATLLVLIVAVLHVFFMILEMFLWTTPTGMRRFKMTPDQAQATAVLAKNIGLYNGFLAAGLIWGVCQSNSEFGYSIQNRFLNPLPFGAGTEC